jgi:hypothetical protein
MTVDTAAIVNDIIALQARFPHLVGMKSSHFEDDTLRFAKGRRWIPNPQYKKQLRQWRKAEAKRERETQETRRKRSYPGPPGEETLVWDADGVEIFIAFAGGESESIMAISAAASYGIPGYENIQLLHSVSGTYEAFVPGYRVSLQLDGHEVHALEMAVCDVLLRHARAATP